MYIAQISGAVQFGGYDVSIRLNDDYLGEKPLIHKQFTVSIRGWHYSQFLLKNILVNSQMFLLFLHFFLENSPFFVEKTVDLVLAKASISLLRTMSWTKVLLSGQTSSSNCWCTSSCFLGDSAGYTALWHPMAVAMKFYSCNSGEKYHNEVIYTPFVTGIRGRCSGLFFCTAQVTWAMPWDLMEMDRIQWVLKDFLGMQLDCGHPTTTIGIPWDPWMALKRRWSFPTGPSFHPRVQDEAPVR